MTTRHMPSDPNRNRRNPDRLTLPLPDLEWALAYLASLVDIERHIALELRQRCTQGCRLCDERIQP